MLAKIGLQNRNLRIQIHTSRVTLEVCKHHFSVYFLVSFSFSRPVSKRYYFVIIIIITLEPEPSTSDGKRTKRSLFQREQVIQMLLTNENASNSDDKMCYENSSSEYKHKEGLSL